MSFLLERRVVFVFVFGAAVVIACTDLGTNETGIPDGGMDAFDGGEPSKKKPRDASWEAAPGQEVDAGDAGDSGVVAVAACRKIPLDCLDRAPANVIEVPSESTLQAALTNAKAGDIIQVRGKTVGEGWHVPADVTLRGCEGAKISGSISFAGNSGTIEGFDVSGAIVADKTGSFVVRYNRFATSGPNRAAVSGRSVDGLAAAAVTLLVEASSFESRDVGIEARADFDATHHVDVTVRNNVFRFVNSPLVAINAWNAGVVDARIEHNTFYNFGTAIRLSDAKASTSGNLFVKGSKAIEGSAYDVGYSFTWEVATAAASPPLSGAFETGDPAFVDLHAGDFRLGPSSAVVDRIPNDASVPGEDYLGCPRPAGVPGAPAQSDVGAFELQP